MPTSYIYLKNEDYAKLVYLAERKNKKVTQIMREWVEEKLKEQEA